jgi:hypothetical protein
MAKVALLLFVLFLLKFFGALEDAVHGPLALALEEVDWSAVES